MSFFQKETEVPSYEEGGDSSTEWWENLRSFVWETIKVVIISLIIIVPVRHFLIQPFYVQGDSMIPNFHDKEYLIINEISYRFENPSRGDVVVFRYLKDRDQFFIKRVLGLPGEEVEITDGVVRIYNEDYVDGIVVDESEYLPKEFKTAGNKRVKLNTDEYFVLGDNRSASLDSRSFGPVSRDDIIGKVWVRGWPISRISKFDSIEYGF